MVDFLNLGRALYIENPDLGYAHSGTTLYGMLGATYLGDGNDYATGNVQSAAGSAGTFTASLSYGYMYQQTPDNYVDYISANTGTLIFSSQDGNGRAVFYSGPGNNYRSIYATFNFGALRDNGASTKQLLMTRYIQYLLGNAVAEEQASTAIRDLSLSPNPAAGRVRISFALDRTERVSVTVYDVAGQKVRALNSGDLERGSHGLTWNGRDDQGRPVSGGAYLVRIEAGEHTMTRTITLVK
jgi:FlgD Ig-like domain